MSGALRDGVDRVLAGLGTEGRLSPHTSGNDGRDLESLLEDCAAQAR